MQKSDPFQSCRLIFERSYVALSTVSKTALSLLRGESIATEFEYSLLASPPSGRTIGEWKYQGIIVVSHRKASGLGWCVPKDDGRGSVQFA